MDTCRVNVTVDNPKAVQVSDSATKLSKDEHDFLSWEANITEWLPRGNVFRRLCFEHQCLNFFNKEGWLKQAKNIGVFHGVELSGKFKSNFVFFTRQNWQIDEG
jgi:hypothetical protein